MKKFLTLLLASAFLISCSDDDAVSNANLDGTWRLTAYLAYMDTLPVFEPGDVTWTFSNSGTQLQTVNNVEEEHPYVGSSGSFQVSTQGNIITIGSQNHRYELNNNELVIKAADPDLQDAPIMVFNR
ncbi:hypothetical protein AM493_11685 [Flavobacterium akiainvivens]|uniref:Lipocalin-like domain-containing protein n=1 Tax=Flavobacterium akiainvivens TaxID=1202724 RepID=A0A0M9VIH6_9FLAO|nr:lipocalin family protein [Flavobacterium akiainvivens]KOS06619.1 hypothetical protein AM493_11685 [Flavobacterium akiainvivens]SFQ08966.1 hypothetical protein SAMN05444144_10122 [Flavobacterium akiainvivens]